MKNIIITLLTAFLISCSNNPAKEFTRSPCADYCNFQDFKETEEYK